MRPTRVDAPTDATCSSHAKRPSPAAADEVERAAWEIVDEWGAQSFPASDPPANW